jgi:hypothetical protein
MTKDNNSNPFNNQGSNDNPSNGNDASQQNERNIIINEEHGIYTEKSDTSIEQDNN